MLSRVAESVFWMSRYIERAENVARFVEANLAIALGGRWAADAQWAPLIYASGDQDEFKKLHGGFSQENVVEFLLFDARNPNSIYGCLEKARENARMLRDILSIPVWESINRFYLRVRDARGERDRIVDQPHEFLQRVKRASHEVIGASEATLSHGDAWNYSRLGRMIERADKTSRILDVKYFVLLPHPSQVGSALDTTQWSALLESTSALHMYRKRFGRISPERVAEFLILDRDFPRSLRFCATQAEVCLRSVSDSPAGVCTNRAEELMVQLNSRFATTMIDEIILSGMHEFIDDFQSRLNDIGAAIHQCFFALRPVEPTATMSQSMCG